MCMSKEEQPSQLNVAMLRKSCVTLKYHSNPEKKEKETQLTNFRFSNKIARAFLQQLRTEHMDP